jgi:hypothetical protein
VVVELPDEALANAAAILAVGVGTGLSLDLGAIEMFDFGFAILKTP